MEASLEGEPAEETLQYLDAEDRRLLYRFLVVIRERYKLADKACFYLERKAGIQYMAAVANLRDVLSHLATTLDPKTASGRRTDQLANAEEHLRRSIVDSYEVALADLEVKFQTLYEKYKRLLLPVMGRHVVLSRAPNKVKIESTLTEIEGLVEKARNVKWSNCWDDSWENGIAGYPDAYDKLEELYSEIEDYWYKYEQLRGGSRQVWLAVWGIGMTVVTFILSYFLYAHRQH